MDVFQESNQPSIYPFGIRIDTPVTVATDLLVTAVCFYAFYKISQMKSNHIIKKYLLIYFASMGMATAIGGIVGHGFLYALGFEWKLPGWFTSMVSIAFLERACIEQARPFIKNSTIRFFSVLNIIELITFMIISFYTLNFLYVEIHSAYGLAFIVFSFSIFVYRKTGNKGNIRFIQAVLLAACAATWFLLKWDFNIWFNHYDVSHVFMALSAWFFFLGSEKVILQAENHAKMS